MNQGISCFTKVQKRTVFVWTRGFHAVQNSSLAAKPHHLLLFSGARRGFTQAGNLQAK